MGELISFRLDKKYPRESKTINKLNAWIERGFNTRHILTTALLDLYHPGLDLERKQGNHDLDAKFTQIGQILDFIEDMQPKPVVSQDFNSEPTILRDSFFVSIKILTKPGRKT